MSIDRRLTRGLPLLIAVGALLVTIHPWPRAAGSQPAASACSTATLSGPYGYRFTGAVLLADGPRVETAAVGLITYDGHGGFAGADMVAANGNMRPRQFTGSYTVAADCTGTGTVVQAGSEDIHTSFVLVAGGQQGDILVTDPGTVLVGHMTKQ